MKVLTRDEYDTLIHAGLRQMGLDDATAAKLAAARWPMFGPCLLTECAARGLALSPQDLADWFAATVGGRWPDGEPVEPMSTWLGPLSVDAFLEWALEHERGTLTFSGLTATARPDVVRHACEPVKAPWN